MAALFSPYGNGQFIDENGDPAVGYLVYTYAAGSTTPLVSFTDSTGTVPQSNPIQIDADGRPVMGQIWLTPNVPYKFLVKDPLGVLIDTVDNITGVASASNFVNQFQPTGLTPTYVSANSFTLVGDQTSTFQVGRRVQLTTTAGTVYGTIQSSVFTSLTTVTLAMDTGMSLDSGLSAVSLSILSATNPALPSLADAGAGISVGNSNGRTLVSATGAVGQCRLTYPGGGSILLSRYNGNLLKINGVLCTIPTTGVSVAATGLTPGTLYYIYATANSGAVSSIEASTTVPTTSVQAGNEGVIIKTGDNTRTLVGQVTPVTGPAFIDTAASRQVLSWFNQRQLPLFGIFATNYTKTNTAPTEVDTSIRVTFNNWVANTVFLSGEISVSVGSPGNSVTVGVALDTANAFGQSNQTFGFANASTNGCMTVTYSGAPSEGNHIATIISQNSAAVNATFVGFGSIGACTLKGYVMG